MRSLAVEAKYTVREFPLFMPGWVAALRRIRVVMLAACLSFAAFEPATAQSSVASPCTIGGSVTTASVPLPGVAVLLKQGDLPIGSTSTGDDGRWRMRVAYGTYRVSYDLRGFAPVERERTINEEHCADAFNVQLEVDPTSRSRGTASRAARPQGATSTPPPVIVIRGRDASLNRAALRERAEALARGEFTLDGQTQPNGRATELTGARSGAPESTPLVTRGPGLASIAGSPSVEVRRVPPPATISAKRLFSATASYTVAGSALDEAPYQLRAGSPQPKPDYLRQSVDFTVGGPLTIPRAFINSPKTNVTLSYSAIRGGNLFDQYATVPAAAMRAGDLSAMSSPVRDPLTGLPFAGNTIPVERIDPAAQTLLTYLPLPNGSGTSRNFHYTSTNRSTQDSLNVRLTHPLVGSETPPTRGGRGGQPLRESTAVSATLNGQVEYRRNVNDRLNALPSIAGIGRATSLRVPISLNVTRRGTQHTASIGYTRNTNDTTNQYAGVVDVASRVGIADASPDPFAWGIPTLSFATLTSVNDLTPSQRTDQRLTLGYSWSRAIRAHRLRLGGDIGDSRTRSRTDQNARGAFVFTGLYSGSDFADFLLGQPQQASVQYGPGVVHLAGRSLSLYVQDDWRRWSTITINAGIRYELVTPFHDEAGRLANLDVAPGFVAVAPVTSGGSGSFSGPFPDALVRTDTNNVAPRIGAAWRVASRTTLRAGYGVSFNTGSYSALARQLSGQPPFAVTNTAIGTATQPLSLRSALSAGASATTNTFGVSRDYDAGVVGTWTIDLSRDMGDAWNLSAGLTRATGSSLDIVRAPNRGPNGLRIAEVQPFLWQTSEGRSHLSSATFRLRRWYVRGVSTSLNYTVARSMDNASTIGGGATVVAQDEQNLAAEWGPSSFSRHHQLSGDLNFELPFGDDHRWLNRGGPWAILLARWSAYVTFSAQTGTPLTARVLSNSADVARGTNGTLRADLTGAPIALDHPTPDRFFNTDAFALPQAGTFGNAGRNLIVGPGSRDLSVQLTRELRLGGTRTLSVQLRASNILNLVNYASVDTVLNSPTFGQVLSVRPLRSTQLNVRWKF